MKSFGQYEKKIIIRKTVLRLHRRTKDTLLGFTHFLPLCLLLLIMVEFS